MDFASRYCKKLKIIAYWIVLFLLIIISRLVYLQILHMESFFTLGIRNFLRTEPIACPRGNILDCNGLLLATNRPVTTLHWQGTGNKILSSQQQSTLTIIKQIIETIEDNKIIQAEKNGAKIIIATDITFAQLSKIMELFPNHANLNISTHFKRFYPNQNIASHILGHLSTLNDFETIGKMGLEKILHDRLQGEQGKLLKTINSIGTNIHQTQIKSALAGQNIITTLDLPLQHIAESLFPQNYNGALILMDPETGALRALVSRPNFDPGVFLNPIENSQWQLLQTGQPFLNRAFNVCYPPASIFKLVTISAALEHGLVDPHDTINCWGYFRFKGRRYHCDNRTGHGKITIKNALAESCNILFYQIATRLPIDLLADYAFRFGLGRKTNLLFPEKEGLVPTSLWKRQEKGEPWWPGETLSCSIGQSYLLVTPIQIACMISSIFEGYLVTPRILATEAISTKPLAIKRSTRNFLKKSMKMAVQTGTGKTVNKIEDIKVFAKTGTGQVKRLSDKKDFSTELFPHAWFVAYFHYKDHKPLTLVIFLEHTGNSRPAKILAKNILMNYRSYMKSKEVAQAA